MQVVRIQDVDVKGKKVLVRVDFNVPIQEGKIQSLARIEASLPTILHLIKAGASVLLISHLGRPEEGKFSAADSLQPIATALSDLLGRPVRFLKNWIEGVSLSPGEVALGENVRFLVGEGANEVGLAQKMAALSDVFVMDAFASAHRAQASTEGVARFSTVACAGFLLQQELDALSQALLSPKRPKVAIVGGAKVSSKIWILKSLIHQVDCLIVGGGIANTFLAANGVQVGESLHEVAFIAEAKKMLEAASSHSCKIILPLDVVVGKSIEPQAIAQTKRFDEISPDDRILDVGPLSCRALESVLAQAGTILWNGPMGVFELPQFSQGTKALALAVANSSAFSIAGGGDTLSAIEQFNVASKISYISTGGGAFLEFLEGKVLPAVSVLQERAKERK